VSPLVSDLLGKARHALERAGGIQRAGYPDVAAREAYVAAFTAARAAILRATGKAPKTHNGVHAEFARLCAQQSELGVALSQFLSRAYDYKQVSDYGTDVGATAGEAGEAICQGHEAAGTRRAICGRAEGDLLTR
jgi:uncharacterized protein (UPF0332 family)